MASLTAGLATLPSWSKMRGLSMSRGAGAAGKAEARDDDDNEKEEDDEEEEDEEEIVGYAYGVKLDVVPCMINPY